jgi:hypothetical protein
MNAMDRVKEQLEYYLECSECSAPKCEACTKAARVLLDELEAGDEN